MAAMFLRLFLLPLLVSAMAITPSIHRRTGLVPSNSGSAVNMTSDQGSYPRANYLQDGTILGTYVEVTGPDFRTSNTTIKVVRSSDNGKSWSGNLTVYTNATFSNYIDNPYPLQLPCGRILLIVRNHYRPDFLNLTLYRLSMWISDDNGDSFTYLNDAVTKVPSVIGAAQGLYEPLLRIAQDGNVQLYYSEEDNPDLSSSADQNSMMRTSTDEGTTWSAAQMISGAGVTARDGMLGVVNTGGSNLIAVFETTEDPNYQFVVDSVFSPDDGKSWGNRSRVYTPKVVGKSAGSPQVIQVGNTTVASFMNSDLTAPGLPGYLNGYNGTAATILTSQDGGLSWGNEYYVFPEHANEPGLLTLECDPTNSSFLLMTSLEPQNQSNYDGTLVSQKVVLI